MNPKTRMARALALSLGLLGATLLLFSGCGGGSSPTEPGFVTSIDNVGWIIFSEAVSPYTGAGALLIVGGCFVAARSKINAPGEVEVVT